jgi:hypothetical protein
VASRRLIASVAAAIAAALATAGCATIPTVGPAVQVKGASGLSQPNLQPVPPVPEANWSEQAIVEGFIAASASFAGNHAAARAFLDPQLRQRWHPGWAAAVVGNISNPVVKRFGPTSPQGASTVTATVTLTAHQLATISDAGHYVNSPASPHYVFRLAQFGSQWLITQLPDPSSVLLLTQADFEEVYQPLNLYVWSPGKVLVPEPVFAPPEDSVSQLASNLVRALLTNQAQSSYLGPLTTTAFPRRTTLLGPNGSEVSISDSTAVVNLGGGAAKARQDQLRNMAAQLVTTLTSGSYGQSGIARSVMLKINGKVRAIDGRAIQGSSAYQYLIPNFPHRSPLYFISPAGVVSELAPGSSAARPLQRPLGRDQRPFSIIAVSPGAQPELAGTQETSKGCVIYYGPISRISSLRHSSLPGPSSAPCTSLSWDRRGNIWVVAGHSVWVLPPGGRQPVSAVTPSLAGQTQPSYQVLALRVAPDGVRAAMLIQNKDGGRQVVMTAIGGSGPDISFSPTAVAVGAGLHEPAAVSWYDPDHLIVLAQSQLYEVPVNGGRAVSVGPVLVGTRTLTAAGPGQIATSGNGEVLTSSGPDQNQAPAAKGTSPAYPG